VQLAAFIASAILKHGLSHSFVIYPHDPKIRLTRKNWRRPQMPQPQCHLTVKRAYAELSEYCYQAMIARFMLVGFDPLRMANFADGSGRTVYLRRAFSLFLA
jgi:hypothetical protein